MNKIITKAICIQQICDKFFGGPVLSGIAPNQVPSRGQISAPDLAKSDLRSISKTFRLRAGLAPKEMGASWTTWN